MAYLQSEIKPESYSSQEELDQAISQVQEKWLDTSVPKLDNKTPREVILEEREKIGNPSKNICLKVLAQPITMITKEDKEAEELFSKALALTKEKKYKEAIETFKKHLKIHPENYVAWGNMGTLYCLLLNKQEALKCLHKALSINPDYKIAKENLALLESVSITKLKKMAKESLIKWHGSRPPKRKKIKS
ncbi:MAG: tetratricopeptide repeat protein [Candidatus Aminicenantia bacterium]